VSCSCIHNVDGECRLNPKQWQAGPALSGHFTFVGWQFQPADVECGQKDPPTEGLGAIDDCKEADRQRDEQRERAEKAEAELRDFKVCRETAEMHKAALSASEQALRDKHDELRQLRDGHERQWRIAEEAGFRIQQYAGKTWGQIIAAQHKRIVELGVRRSRVESGAKE